MRPQSKIKPIVVSYKGWHMTQTPWNGYDGKCYALMIFKPDGKMCMHAGHSKHHTRKELKLVLMHWVNKDYKILLEKGKIA